MLPTVGASSPLSERTSALAACASHDTRTVAEYDDELYLTSARADPSARNESEASTSSGGTDSGWSRLQHRLEHLSGSISRKIPHRHSRKSSEESQENSSSSGFSSAQHSPKGGAASLTAYENFLIVDDDCAVPNNVETVSRTGPSSSGRCTGVLRMNDELGVQRADCFGPSTDAALQEAASASAHTAPQSSNCSWWDKVRIITNAITLRQQPFQPFTPSPSGSLLPNTSPPSASSVAALRQQQHQHERQEQRQHDDSTEGKSLQQIQEERRQRIRRFVYIAQGALVVIVALIWLASNFVNLKSPTPQPPSLVATSANGSAFLPSLASSVEAPTTTEVASSESRPRPSVSSSSVTQQPEITRRNESSVVATIPKGFKKAAATAGLSGNKVQDEDAVGTAAAITVDENKERRRNLEGDDDDQVHTDDPHNVDRRWRSPRSTA